MIESAGVLSQAIAPPSDLRPHRLDCRVAGHALVERIELGLGSVQARVTDHVHRHPADQADQPDRNYHPVALQGEEQGLPGSGEAAHCR
jgi:hypothetical protein